MKLKFFDFLLKKLLLIFSTYCFFIQKNYYELY